MARYIMTWDEILYMGRGLENTTYIACKYFNRTEEIQEFFKDINDLDKFKKYTVHEIRADLDITREVTPLKFSTITLYE